MLTWDSRYRLIAPFGKDTIRRFANNASQMKKLAGYHFEDLLQVRDTTISPRILASSDIPIVCAPGAGRAPPRTAQWCYPGPGICDGLLARICQAPVQTLASFEQLTTDLGVLLRHFSLVTCSAFNTMELPRESAARMRRAANNPSARASGSGGAKRKTFSLGTYKLHALGDYPRTIRECGTTDNYTSQRVGGVTEPAKRHYH